MSQRLIFSFKVFSAWRPRTCLDSKVCTHRKPPFLPFSVLSKCRLLLLQHIICGWLSDLVKESSNESRPVSAHLRGRRWYFHGNYEYASRSVLGVVLLGIWLSDPQGGYFNSICNVWFTGFVMIRSNPFDDGVLLVCLLYSRWPWANKFNP